MNPERLCKVRTYTITIISHRRDPEDKSWLESGRSGAAGVDPRERGFPSRCPEIFQGKEPGGRI